MSTYVNYLIQLIYLQIGCNFDDAQAAQAMLSYIISPLNRPGDVPSRSSDESPSWGSNLSWVNNRSATRCSSQYQSNSGHLQFRLHKLHRSDAFHPFSRHAPCPAMSRAPFEGQMGSSTRTSTSSMPSLVAQITFPAMPSGRSNQVCHRP